MTTNDIIKYIKTYEFESGFNTDRSFTKQQLIKFVIDVQNKMEEIPLENFNKKLLPYCGAIDAGVGKAEGWKVMEALSNGEEYCYINNFEFGNIINNDAFKDAVFNKIGNQEICNDLINGSNNGESEFAIEGSEILSFVDFVSKRIILEVASGDVKPLIYTVEATKVFFRTEFDALLENDKVISMWGNNISIIKKIVENGYPKFLIHALLANSKK